MRKGPRCVVLASLAVPLVFAASSLAKAAPGQAKPATPPWMEQGETPLQKSIKESFATRRNGGGRVPKAKYTIAILKDAAAVKTARQILQDPSAPAPPGRRVVVQATTRLDYAGPEEAGLDRWPPMKVKKQGAGGEQDLTRQYEDFLASRFPPDPARGWPGIWSKYERGKEPRSHTITETIIYTTPKQPAEGGLQAFAAADGSPVTATSEEPILLGFTYLGPNISDHIADDLEVLGVKIGDYDVGFTLDWALGLRLPAEVSADGPVNGPMVAGSSYSFSSRLSGLDWSPSDYSTWGVAAENGNEFVLHYDFSVWAKVNVLPILGGDLCPECSAGFSDNKSTSFTTPLGPGASITLPGFQIPIGSFDIGILSLLLGVEFAPEMVPKDIAARWEGVAGTAASGGGGLVYGASGQDYAFGQIKACLVGPSHEALVRLSDFRYRIEKFLLDVGLYMNLKIIGQGVWDAESTLAKVDLGSLGLGDGLGRYQECPWQSDGQYHCSPQGPPNVVELSIPVEDRDAPATSIKLSGAVGTERWYRSDVEAILTAVDNPVGCGIGVRDTEYHIGGAGGVYSGPFTVATEGVNTITFHSTDHDGNVELNRQDIIKIDKTPPLISGAPTTPANRFGWHNEDVTVHFQASDAVSGVSYVESDKVLGAEAANQSVTRWASDHAGNWASATVTGINIDKTAPKVAITTPQTRSYANTESLRIAWTASDSLSGIAAEQGTLDAVPMANGGAVDLLLLGAGPHTVVATAVDRADNTGRAQVTFAVRLDIYGLDAALTRACQMGWISSAGACDSLHAKLLAAKGALERGGLGAARNQLEAFLNELDAQRGKAVSIRAYDLLRADVLFVRDHLG